MWFSFLPFAKKIYTTMAFGPKKRAYYAVLAHFCCCPIVTLVTFSSNPSTFKGIFETKVKKKSKKNHKYPKKSKNFKNPWIKKIQKVQKNPKKNSKKSKNFNRKSIFFYLNP